MILGQSILTVFRNSWVMICLLLASIAALTLCPYSARCSRIPVLTGARSGIFTSCASADHRTVLKRFFTPLPANTAKCGNPSCRAKVPRLFIVFSRTDPTLASW